MKCPKFLINNSVHVLFPGPCVPSDGPTPFAGSRRRDGKQRQEVLGYRKSLKLQASKVKMDGEAEGKWRISDDCVPDACVCTLDSSTGVESMARYRGASKHLAGLASMPPHYSVPYCSKLGQAAFPPRLFAQCHDALPSAPAYQTAQSRHELPAISHRSSPACIRKPACMRPRPPYGLSPTLLRSQSSYFSETRLCTSFAS